MNMLNENTALRIVLILLLTVGGLALVIGGWKVTGEMKGLLTMLVGLVLLIAALAVYNKPFQDKKKR